MRFIRKQINRGKWSISLISIATIISLGVLGIGYGALNDSISTQIEIQMADFQQDIEFSVSSGTASPTTLSGGDDETVNIAINTDTSNLSNNLNITITNPELAHPVVSVIPIKYYLLVQENKTSNGLQFYPNPEIDANGNLVLHEGSLNKADTEAFNISIVAPGPGQYEFALVLVIEQFNNSQGWEREVTINGVVNVEAPPETPGG